MRRQRSERNCLVRVCVCVCVCLCVCLQGCVVVMTGEERESRARELLTKLQDQVCK